MMFRTILFLKSDLDQIKRDSKLKGVLYRKYYLKKIDLINQEGFINVYQTMCTEMKQMLLNDLKINPDILRC